MCQFKSGIILKDRVFVPDYDSHTDMLEELKINDSYANAKTLFVRAELIPKNYDVFSDVSEWTFKVDQDIVPEWFVAEYEKERMIEAVKAWAKDHIFIGVDNLNLGPGKSFYVKNCKNVTARENSSVEARENSSVVAWENSSVVARENSSVVAWGNSSVEARENSSVVARENSSVVAWENSSVVAWGNSSVVAWGKSIVVKDRWSSFNTDRLVLSENSTFKDCVTRTLYQSGDFKLVSVADGKIKREV